MSRLEPHELRAGNVIAVPDGKKHYKIEPISAYQIYQFTRHKDGSGKVPLYYNNLFPVRINKDWLEDLGFFQEMPGLWSFNISTTELPNDTKKQVNLVYDTRNDLCELETIFFTPEFPNPYGNDITLDHIKYVHQLQNIIFDISEEDTLIIKNEDLEFKA